MIKAEHLVKKFGDKTAVDDLSFEVATNKVTGFLGPNGAGKSTTMRLMVGLANGRGTTLFNGKPLHAYNQPSEMVGIVFEAKAYHPTRTARSHLEILAIEANVPKSRVDEVLDIVGLKSEANKGPGKFSLGMSQRLGLAAALLSKPKFLLLDEPANGLDPEGIVWLRQLLISYADKDHGVLVSSHLLSEMAQLADNVVVIGRGKLLADTSMKSFIAGNVGSSVYVRVSDSTKMAQVFDKEKLPYKKVDDGFELSGVKTDKIGQLAFINKVTILELSIRSASLEEAFLEVTAGSEEFAGKKATK
ncbi:MAG: ATP-binding cassette domain-containing protein [Candidatus Saccharimonadales bacterium]